MFVVTEAEAAAIRAVYRQRGEFAAAVELRRRFPGIIDNVQARECVRTIAGWKSPPHPLKELPEWPRRKRVGSPDRSSDRCFTRKDTIPQRIVPSGRPDLLQVSITCFSDADT
jgi:hypothetical protein